MIKPWTSAYLAIALAALSGGATAGEARQSVTYGSTEAVDVALPDGHASDAWLASGSAPWREEIARREAELRAYLGDADAGRARGYGFHRDQTPALAWNWFSEHPIGFGGMPHVLLQTILSLDPATETDPHLLKIAQVWKKPSQVPGEEGKGLYTLDHLGLGPNPADYRDGVAAGPLGRSRPLPNGLVYDPRVEPEEVTAVELQLRLMRDGVFGSLIRLVDGDYTPTIAKMLVLIRGKIRKDLYGGELDYDTEFDRFQEAPETDAVFFSCTACHQGRVIVGGRMDGDGNVVERGKTVFLPGMPNTEVEPQAFSRALLETGLALIESGFSIDAEALPSDPGVVVPSSPAIVALYTRMLSRAMDDEIVKTIYGPGPDEVRRARLQTFRVALDFPTHVGGIISTAIKTQYLYYQVGKRFAYSPDNSQRASPDQPVPDVLVGNIGQMDAFGAASGLVAIHTLRPDGSFIRFMHRDNSENPLFAGLPGVPGFEASAEPEAAGKRIRDRLAAWAPPVPAPIDIPGLSWTAHKVLANWDGNQGAAARALSSGTSATGDPRKVNVRIHEPFNPFMANLPPAPYPFEVDRERALRGKRIFEGEGLAPDSACAGCHLPGNATVYPAAMLGVDPNRSLVTTDVSRYGLASLVMEACRLFIRKNPDNTWCLPKDDDGEIVTDWTTSTDEYFKDVPGRVRRGEAGYKADMLHGIWAQAPYLHNGSVPTLAQLICPAARPDTFKRGVLFYDPDMVGFEWAVTPRQRHSPSEVHHVVEYDTGEFSRSNGGHEFGSRLCPDMAGLDPVADRAEIAVRILASEVGDLLEYLKTL